MMAMHHLLMKLGTKLIINAGLLLVSLRYSVLELTKPTRLEALCEELKELNKYEMAKEIGCSFELDLVSVLPTFFATSVLEAISWLVPFLFASVGVNSFSQGLISSNPKTTLVESYIKSKEQRTQRILKGVLSKII